MSVRTGDNNDGTHGLSAALPAREARKGTRMKKFLSMALVMAPLALAGCGHRTTVVVYNPPPGYTQAAQQGYHNGVQAAQRDMRAGLGPDAARHPNFNNPPVPPPLREDFRRGFQEGYRAVYAGGPR
ncbi:MAG TPA: hypothetical protein VHX60_01820 [Acidobacteriaceae bacterium]|nr:hypothetical protein [Acidobacteriaceae bacterium]